MDVSDDACLAQFRDLIKSWTGNWLAGLFGVSDPIHRLETEADGKDAKYVAELNGPAVTKLIDQVGTLLGVPPQPTVIQATTSQGIGGPDAGAPPPSPTPQP